MLDGSSAAGLFWQASAEVKVPRTWDTGYYNIDFVDVAGNRQESLAYIVLKSGKKSADILVQLSTNTYQAYNRWGGQSLYKSELLGLGEDNGGRGAMISFDRPTNTQFFRWEYYYVLWLEKFAQENGFTVDYASNFDVHNKPELLTPYKLVVSVGHDEYWTKEQFESFYQRIFELGQNVLFLNENTAYWQVRYADINGIYDDEFNGRQMNGT